MKKSFDYGLAVLFVLVFASVAALVTAAYYVVLKSLQLIPQLHMDATSTQAVWLFALGMAFASLPIGPLRYACLFLFALISRGRATGKAYKLADQIAGFFLLLAYLHFLDEALAGISLSLYAKLALAFIHSMALDLVTSEEARATVRQWRKKRRAKRKERAAGKKAA